MRGSLFVVQVFFGCLVFVELVNAAPKEVVLIRHADKWPFESHSTSLNPTGYMRAVAFAYYFIDRFGKPDFLIATNPERPHSSSIRELQTLAPLASLLAKENTSSRASTILHHYRSDQTEKLASDLLRDDRFKGKKLLICWHHKSMKDLVKELGVKKKFRKWPVENFDDVWVLQYGTDGELESFAQLEDQYPMSEKTWESILENR
jgi:phosphohistidine phosphatase SixA